MFGSFVLFFCFCYFVVCLYVPFYFFVPFLSSFLFLFLFLFVVVVVFFNLSFLFSVFGSPPPIPSFLFSLSLLNISLLLLHLIVVEVVGVNTDGGWGGRVYCRMLMAVCFLLKLSFLCPPKTFSHSNMRESALYISDVVTSALHPSSSLPSSPLGLRATAALSG